jgi:hypothetical protein
LKEGVDLVSSVVAPVEQVVHELHEGSERVNEIVPPLQPGRIPEPMGDSGERDLTGAKLSRRDVAKEILRDVRHHRVVGGDIGLRAPYAMKLQPECMLVRKIGEIGLQEPPVIVTSCRQQGV